MKKQLIASAVAATMASVAMADISITGDAKYEYDHSETSAGVKSNTANTEMHINFAGKTGDTGVVAKFELDTSGDDGAGIDLEDMYMTTKVGDINVKAGNWATGTSALLGELENGGRAQNKIDLRTTIGGVTLYAGNADKESSEASNSGTVTSTSTSTSTLSGSSVTTTTTTTSTFSSTAGTADGDTLLNGNMYAGAIMSVAGNTIEFKKNSNTRDSYGIKGSVQGVNYRYEAMDDTTNGDATYIELDTTVQGIKLQYAAIDTDANSLVDEDDSGVFAVSFSDSAKVSTQATEQKQFAVSTSIDGTTVTVKSGEITKGVSSTKDLDYTQFQAKRKLASGATAVVTYTDRDQITTGGSNKNLEIELNVAF
jgi:hypothetical protein